MEQYVINEHQCRSVMLLDYFNEQQLTRCGVCDYCRRRNKIELNDAEFEDLNFKLNALLAKQHLPLNEIISQLNFKNEDKVLKALQWMIDNKQLKYDEENRLGLERGD